MIIVSVHLVSAITGRTTTLGQMSITNDGTSNDPKRGSYEVEVYRKGTLKVQRAGRVENHARLALSVWSLVAKALKSVRF